MLRIRAELPQDRESIHDLNAQASGREDEALLADALRRSGSFLHEASLIAEQDGCLVGHSLFTKIRIRGECDSVPALALAPM